MATKKKDDAGQADVEKKQDRALEQGFIGRRVDQRDDSEYSLQSGPEAPGPADAELRTAYDDLEESA